MLDARRTVLVAHSQAMAQWNPAGDGDGNTEGHWAIYRSGEAGDVLFGKGPTEQDAWADAAEKILNDSVLRR